MNGALILISGRSPLHFSEPVCFAKTMNTAPEEWRSAEDGLLVQRLLFREASGISLQKWSNGSSKEPRGEPQRGHKVEERFCPYAKSVTPLLEARNTAHPVIQGRLNQQRIVYQEMIMVLLICKGFPTVQLALSCLWVSSTLQKRWYSKPGLTVKGRSEFSRTNSTVIP